MKKILSLLFIIPSFLSFSQVANVIQENELLFAMRLSPKSLEQKAGLDDTQFNNSNINNIKRAYADIVDEIFRLPYQIEKILRYPSQSGLDYTNINTYVTSKDNLITCILSYKINDYSKLETQLLEKANLAIIDKGTYFEILENTIFTDKKTLVLIRTLHLSRDQKIVNTKEEALSSYSFYGTEEEYKEKLSIPIEDRKTDQYDSNDDYYGYDTDVVYETATEAVEASDEVTHETIEEVAVDTTEASPIYEEPVSVAPGPARRISSESTYQQKEKKEYYYIDYYKPYVIVNNSAQATAFFKPTTLDGGLAAKKFNSNTSEAFAILNGNQLLPFYTFLLKTEFRSLTREMGIRDVTLQDFKLLKDMSLTMDFKAENGEANLKTTLYPNKKLHRKLRKVNAQKIDSKLTAYIPKSATGYFASAYNTRATGSLYQDLYKELTSSIPGVNTIFNESFKLAEMVLDEKAISKFISGQSVFYIDGTHKFKKTYTDYSYNKKTGKYEHNEVSELQTVPSFFYLLGTKDQESWKSIAKLIEISGYVEQKSGIYTFYSRPLNRRYYYSEPRLLDIFAIFVDGAVVISNDYEKLYELKTNGTRDIKSVSKSKFRRQNSIGYLNFSRLVGHLTDNSLSKKMAFKAISGGIDGLEIKGTKIKRNRIESSMTIKSTNKDQNIMLQFMEIMNNMDKISNF